MKSLADYMVEMQPVIEDYLQSEVGRVNSDLYSNLHEMLAYHMGWEGQAAGPSARGKRIRPVLLLLCCAGAGQDWQRALPAAAAVELLHNFSLIHDDIEDRSAERRGRPTLWSKWGIAQAINTGDLMLTLANQAVLRLSEANSSALVLRAMNIFQQACNHLTRGQFLDISYESEVDLPLTAYWPMITGKTAALLAACCELGALVGKASPPRQKAFNQFGHFLGLAFQAQDDWLGVWGDPAQMGKSAASDLLNKKKTLPVLYALEKKGEFYQRWIAGPISVEEIPEISRMLSIAGAENFVLDQISILTEKALLQLSLTGCKLEPGAVLQELAHSLLRRQK